MLHLFIVGCVSTWGGETDSPPPLATSALAAISSEEEGLHAGPLPHTFGVYFRVDAAYHGGGRIGTLPSSSQWRGVLRRRRDTIPACTWEGEGQALFLTTSVRSTTTCRLCSAGCSWTRSSWVTDCRDASAIPSVWVGFYTRMQDGTARDTMLRMCGAVVPVGVGMPAVGTPSATPSVWVGVGSCTDGALRRHHGLWDVCILHTGAGLGRSGRSATPCGVCAGCSWDDRAGLPAVGTPSATPSNWVRVGQLH